MVLRYKQGKHQQMYFQGHDKLSLKQLFKSPIQLQLASLEKVVGQVSTHPGRPHKLCACKRDPVQPKPHSTYRMTGLVNFGSHYRKFPEYKLVNYDRNAFKDC